MGKTAFVAVVGKPNVGKSSLVNAWVGEKVSITGPKAQTTRNKIIGIRNTENYQMVFVDTPGRQKPKSKLGEYMEKSSEQATSGVDVIVIVIDSSRIDERDYALLEKYKRAKCPVYVVFNKLDLVTYEQIFPKLATFNTYTYVKAFFNVSVKRKKHLEKVLEALEKECKEGEYFYPTDVYTDKSMRFMASEVIREKALLFLQDEIPHGIAVEVTSFDEEETEYYIEADVICEKESHKAMVIGAKGSMLKKIGTASRKALEKMFEMPVVLKLYVKSKTGWRDDISALKMLGYDAKDV